MFSNRHPVIKIFVLSFLIGFFAFESVFDVVRLRRRFKLCYFSLLFRNRVRLKPAKELNLLLSKLANG